MIHSVLRRFGRCLCLLCAVLILTGAAGAEILYDEGWSTFPVQKKDGAWLDSAPRPFIKGEMGEGLLEIWHGRVNVYDCMIVRCNGEVMMIDGGTSGNFALTREFLAQMGIEHIDYLFNTHHHDDHLEAQVRMMNRGFSIGRFLTPYERNYPVEAQQFAEQAADKAGIPYCTIRHGDTMMLGGENGAQITFYRWTKNANANFSSMMCKIVYGDRSAYFMADVSGDAQVDLGLNYLDVIPWDSDIYKVGHHGYMKQDENILRAVSPELCIIPNSVVAAEECIQQLDKLGLDWRITTKGTIYLRTDGGDDWHCVQDKTYLNK